MQRDYRLEDIAEVSVASDELQLKLQQLSVGRAPRAGYVANISRQAIAARIEQRYSGLSQRIVWRGVQVSRIRTLTQQFDYVHLQTLARGYLQAWLANRFEYFEIHSRGAMKDPLLPAGEVRLAVASGKSLSLNKRMSVWVDVYVDEQLYRSLPIWFAVSAYKEVFELVEDRPVGYPIELRDLRTSRHDIAALAGKQLLVTQPVTGKRTRRRLPAGAVLLAGDLETIPAVSKGERVEVIASVGAVTLKVSGLALQDGNAGERILLTKPDGSERYSAVVTGEGRVTVGGSKYE